MKNTTKSKNNAIWFGVLTGTCLALAVSLIGTLLGAALLNADTIQEGSLFPVTVGIWAVAAFAGAIVTVSLTESSKLIALLVTNGLYLLVLASIGILFFETNFGRTIPAFLAVVAANIPVVVIMINAKGRKSKKMRYSFR